MRCPSFAAVLELLKPITWFAPMWAFACGVAASGQPIADGWGKAAVGILLAGPLVCATSQAVNDWYDRHVDAINEPYRPIPSGRIPNSWGLVIACAWTLLSLAVAAMLGQLVLTATAVGLLAAWAYSAPPLRLKQNGWWGNAAVAVCSEGLPWLTGVVVMSAVLPDWRVIAVAGLYSFGAHGIMTLNDFKSVEGDRRMGIRSLPVQLGTERAAAVAAWMMALPQIVVVGILAEVGRPWHAAIVLGLLAVQVRLMGRMMADPRGRAAWYNATGTTLYVIGMLVAALALRPNG